MKRQRSRGVVGLSVLLASCSVPERVPARSTAPSERSHAPVAAAPAPTSEHQGDCNADPQHGEACLRVPPPPANADCIIEDTVDSADVVWHLSARVDAMPTLRPREASVRATLWGSPPIAAVDVENDAMRMRLASVQHPHPVVLKSAIVVERSLMPDGVTDRFVTSVSEGHVMLALDPEPTLPGPTLGVVRLPCSQVGLKRRGARPALPEALREVELRPGAVLVTASGTLSAQAWHDMPTRGLDHGPGAMADHRLISLRPCGTAILGQVHSSHVLPLDAKAPGRGGSERCPHTGAHASWGIGLTQLRTCRRQLPLFVRSATLTDRVGSLKGGARIQVVEVRLSGEPPDVPGMTDVYVADSAVDVLPGAVLALRTADLQYCGAE